MNTIDLCRKVTSTLRHNTSAFRKVLLLALVSATSAYAAHCASKEPKLYAVPKGGLSQFPVREKGSRATQDYLMLEEGISIGHPLPNYTLTTANKKPFNVSQLKGRIAVLDFWGISCGPCLRAMPHLGKLAQKYRSRNVAFLSVCESGDWNTFQQRVKEFNPTKLNFYMDTKSGSEGKSLRDLIHNSMGQPAQIIIDKNGKVVGALQGYDDIKDPNMTLLQHSIDVALSNSDK